MAGFKRQKGARISFELIRGLAVTSWPYGRCTSVLQRSWKGRAERRHFSQRHIYYLTAAFPRTRLGHTATVHTHCGSHLGGRHQTLKEKQKLFPSISSVPAHWDIIEEGAWFGMISLFLREMPENMRSPGVSAAVCGIYEPPGFDVCDGCTSSLWVEDTFKNKSRKKVSSFHNLHQSKPFLNYTGSLLSWKKSISVSSGKENTQFSPCRNRFLA